MDKDIKVIQDTKIIQQVLGKFPETGNQINVIYINQIKEEENGNGSDHKEFDFESFIESLPQPRLKILVERAVGVAHAKFNNEVDAGRWLGGGRKLISYRKMGMNKLIEEECK